MVVRSEELLSYIRWPSRPETQGIHGARPRALGLAQLCGSELSVKWGQACILSLPATAVPRMK